MLTAGEVIDNCFLEVRCALLELAATLDRHDLAAEAGSDETPIGDARLDKIYQSLAILAEKETSPDRAERLLNLFSDLD
jgi:hypothetical protein